MSRGNRFTRRIQPAPCLVCRAETTGVEGTKLCRACFDAAGLENEHADGLHNDGAAVRGCPSCNANEKE